MENSGTAFAERFCFFCFKYNTHQFILHFYLNSSSDWQILRTPICFWIIIESTSLRLWLSLMRFIWEIDWECVLHLKRRTGDFARKLFQRMGRASADKLFFSNFLTHRDSDSPNSKSEVYSHTIFGIFLSPNKQPMHYFCVKLRCGTHNNWELPIWISR